MPTDLLDAVKAAALEVYATLGSGYEERVYEEAMAVEFRERGIAYELERNTEIFYHGVTVGTHRLDFILERQLVVALKAAASIAKSHISQTASYLRTLGLQQGVVVNFAYPDRDGGPEVRTVTSANGSDDLEQSDPT